jgi:hypothetical protein
MLVTMYQDTRKYVNESDVCDIGPVYKASFRMHRVNVIGFLKLSLFRRKSGWERGAQKKFRCNN